MNIKTYVEELLIEQKETSAVIVEISKTGSQLFKNKPHDLDYIVICSGFEQRAHRANYKEDGITYDLFIFDTTAIDAQLDFNDLYYINTAIKKYNYFNVVKEVIYGGYDHGWDMLAHEEEYKAFIKNAYDNSKVTLVRNTPYKYSKYYVHYYIILKIYENQSIELTSEMLADIEKLYNPRSSNSSIMDWVIEKMNEIK